MTEKFGPLIPEVLSDKESEFYNWENARLNTDTKLDGSSFVVELTAEKDPTNKAVGLINIARLKSPVDFPVNDLTPLSVLERQLNPSLPAPDEIDPDTYPSITTDSNTIRPYLALLNRITARSAPDQVHSWFYETFDVQHQEAVEQTSIGSHGALTEYGQTFNITLDVDGENNRIKNADMTPDLQTEKAITLTHKVHESIPHLSIKPVPVNTLMERLRASIHSLPPNI